MSSFTLLGGAIAIFVVAALLYYQSHQTYEGYENVPADLNRAPVAQPSNMVPTSTQRPMGVPGAMVAPKEAMATLKDLAELDSKIMTWLDAASQRERNNPASLTPSQLQERVILQARLREIRNQLGTGVITDKAAIVNQEILHLRTENMGWQQLAPNLDKLYEFAQHSSADSFLTATQYVEFRGLFQAGLDSLRGHTLPDPLQKVRLQQLQVFAQELQNTERKFNPPPIRVSAARLFLQQMLKPDQPLPTLFSMEPNPVVIPRASANPADVIQQLKDIQWTLTVKYVPGQDNLMKTVTEMLGRMESGEASVHEVAAARSSIAEFNHVTAPAPAPSATCSIEPNHEPYDMPKHLQKRANTLCAQIREAFPQDAEALGCPSSKRPIQDEYEAETTINTVCSRLRFSVPTVTPEQFNCPRHNV